MKKNIAMRLAAILFILTMISTCAFSTTFAKYVTSNESTDTARVAKFGVKVNVTNDSMFKKTYETNDTSVEASITHSVTSNSDFLLAPGTSGELTEVTLTGTPEVAVSVTYDAELTLTGWTLSDSTEYCPLVINVEGTPYSIDGSSIHSIAELKTAVENAIEACKKNYEPNTDLSKSAVGDAAPSVTWSWAFYTSDANDLKDTELGKLAADGNAPKITLTITTTVTQID